MQSLYFFAKGLNGYGKRRTSGSTMKDMIGETAVTVPAVLCLQMCSFLNASGGAHSLNILAKKEFKALKIIK